MPLPVEFDFYFIANPSMPKGYVIGTPGRGLIAWSGNSLLDLIPWVEARRGRSRRKNVEGTLYFSRLHRDAFVEVLTGMGKIRLVGVPLIAPSIFHQWDKREERAQFEAEIARGLAETRPTAWDRVREEED